MNEAVFGGDIRQVYGYAVLIECLYICFGCFQAWWTWLTSSNICPVSSLARGTSTSLIGGVTAVQMQCDSCCCLWMGGIYSKFFYCWCWSISYNIVHELKGNTFVWKSEMDWCGNSLHWSFAKLFILFECWLSVLQEFSTGPVKDTLDSKNQIVDGQLVG